MDAGRLDKRVTFMRRPVISETERGDYAPAFIVWAGFRPISVREAAQGGSAQNIENGSLMVRTSEQTRSITNADRVTIDARDFAIDGVGLPDRRTGFITLSVSSNLGGQ